MADISMVRDQTLTFAANTERLSFWYLREMVKQMQEAGVPDEAGIKLNGRDQNIEANWTS